MSANPNFAGRNIDNEDTHTKEQMGEKTVVKPEGSWKHTELTKALLFK